MDNIFLNVNLIEVVSEQLELKYIWQLLSINKTVYDLNYCRNGIKLYLIQKQFFKLIEQMFTDSHEFDNFLKLYNDSFFDNHVISSNKNISNYKHKNDINILFLEMSNDDKDSYNLTDFNKNPIVIKSSTHQFSTYCRVFSKEEMHRQKYNGRRKQVPIQSTKIHDLRYDNIIQIDKPMSMINGFIGQYGSSIKYYMKSKSIIISNYNDDFDIFNFKQQNQVDYQTKNKDNINCIGVGFLNKNDIEFNVQQDKNIHIINLIGQIENLKIIQYEHKQNYKNKGPQIFIHYFDNIKSIQQIKLNNYIITKKLRQDILPKGNDDMFNNDEMLTHCIKPTGQQMKNDNQFQDQLSFINFYNKELDENGGKMMMDFYRMSNLIQYN